MRKATPTLKYCRGEPFKEEHWSALLQVLHNSQAHNVIFFVVPPHTSTRQELDGHLATSFALHASIVFVPRAPLGQHVVGNAPRIIATN